MIRDKLRSETAFDASHSLRGSDGIWKMARRLGALRACGRPIEGSRQGSGGEGEIRTHGTREGTTVFETVPIDHSGTSPREARYSIRNTKGKLAGRVPEECRRTHQMGLEGEPAWHGAWM